MDNHDENMEQTKLYEDDIYKLLNRESKTATLEDIIIVLKRIRDYMKDHMIRKKVESSHVASFATILARCTSMLSGGYDNAECSRKEVLSCLAEVYRCLRNCCVGCRENQNLVTSHQECIECTKTLLMTAVNMEPDHPDRQEFSILFRCAVQFLGNYVSGHFENGKNVWELFSDCFSGLLQYGDTILLQYTCMVIHTALAGLLKDSEGRKQLATSTAFVTIVTTITKEISEQDIDWGIFVIEDALQVEEVFGTVMEKLDEKHRIFFLEVLINQLNSVREEELEAATGLPCSDTLLSVCGQVVDNSYSVLILASQDMDKQPHIEPEVVVKEIEILGLATSFHRLYPELQERSDLLTCCVYLLDNVHKLGQVEDSVFHPVQKLMDGEADQDHPIFGLKKDLIQVIGNMSYKHRGNQDRVRELNGIPLILDHTSIDKKNPFITQWAILAIRNLCADNQDNKAILAELKQQGIANNASELNDLGIEAELRGDKIYVKPSSRGGTETEVKPDGQVPPSGVAQQAGVEHIRPSSRGDTEAEAKPDGQVPPSEVAQQAGVGHIRPSSRGDTEAAVKPDGQVPPSEVAQQAGVGHIRPSSRGDTEAAVKPDGQVPPSEVAQQAGVGHIRPSSRGDTEAAVKPDGQVPPGEVAQQAGVECAGKENSEKSTNWRKIAD